MYVSEQRATTLEKASVLADEYDLTHRVRDKPRRVETVSRPNSPLESSNAERIAFRTFRKCNYCRKPGHLVTECLTLKRKNAKSAALVAIERKPPLILSVSEVSECGESEAYKPFVRVGYVSLLGSDNLKPVKIL